MDAPLHVVQVNLQMDELRRDPDTLLAAWPTLVDVAEAASSTGVRVTVLQAAAREAVLERRGVRYLFVEERRPRGLRRWAGPWATPARRAILRQAAELGADVVHIHGLAFPLHTRDLASALEIPVLVQDRANAVPPRWRRTLDRFGFREVAAVAFTARELAEPWVRSRVLRPQLPVLEILGASSRFEPGHRDEARAATGIGGDPCLLWVGRLNAGKDPLTVLEAVALASEALPGIQLWCCYREAPLLDLVRRRIAADRRLEGRVTLMGAVPHPRVETLCRAADLFVSASRHEATGFALLEALACGLPPVVTDIPSFRRITGARVGSLVPPGDPRALARAVLEQAQREREPERRAVRKHFLRALSFEALGRELRSAYEAVVRPGAQPVGRARP